MNFDVHVGFAPRTSTSATTLFRPKNLRESDLGAAVQCGSRIETARVRPRHSPFTAGSSDGPDELSSFYFGVVWWSGRLGGHSDVAVM